MDPDELQKLMANPTERFYMVNLIKYRDRAVYADGRETDLTGREANALYDPLPFIQAMGGRIVYNSAVDQQIDGADDVRWEDVAIVEYPCPIGFLAMVTSSRIPRNPDPQGGGRRDYPGHVHRAAAGAGAGWTRTSRTRPSHLRPRPRRSTSSTS